MYRSIIIVLIAMQTIISCKNMDSSNLSVKNLRCDKQENPLGIDTSSPELSWQIESVNDSVSQTAYHILVSSSPELLKKDVGDLWDSEKTMGKNSNQVIYSGGKIESGITCHWKVRVWDQNGAASPWSQPAEWSMGLLDSSDWEAKWISSGQADKSPMPLFRKDFNISDKIKNARLYISGLGYYEAWLNGKKVGDHVLDPAQTNYDKYALYSTYKITDLVIAGENTIGVMLGDGWYNQNKAFGIDLSYGKPILICQLELEYQNGTKETIATDESWEWTEGPILSANVYAGESYDARREIENWSKPEGRKGEWKSSVLAVSHPPALRSQLLPPIKKMKELSPKKIYPIDSGRYVFDLGQNFAGWVRIKVNEPVGTTIRIRMSEEVYPDSSLDFTSTGVFATQFIQTETYICKGSGIEEWEPRFTYHGFRYAEVSGLSSVPNAEALTGIVVHSSVSPVGTFACSDAQINKLHELTLWTLISNIHGFPSDCPHREKCGWLGDAHAIAPMSIYNFDMETFWIKYLHDIRSSAEREGVTIHHQEKNRIFYQAYKKPGIPYMISPGKRECGAASPDWGTALVQIPWYLYLYYGNSGILEEFYPDMKTWVDYISNLSVNNIVTQGLGDWCPPGGNEQIDCPYELSSTAYHYLDLKIIEQVANKLGFSNDESLFRERRAQVKQAFIKRFYDEKNKTFGSQTANALSLDLGLVPEGDETSVSNAIAKDVAENFSGFPNTGIFGLSRIFDALARFGNEELAHQILTGKGKRSFENMWKIYDATTLWEELPVDEIAETVYIRDKFGSHNHPMQGGFDAWFYKGIAGISPVPVNSGFRTIRFEPMLTQQLEWAEASYMSKYGLIKSSWKWGNNKFNWEIVIPPNCDGQVFLPAVGKSRLQINGKEVSESLLIVSTENGKRILNLPSGKFVIEN